MLLRETQVGSKIRNGDFSTELAALAGFLDFFSFSVYNDCNK